MDWIAFWDTVSVLQVVGWILGGLGIIAFVVKGWPTFRRFIAFVDALLSLPAFIARTDETLEVHTEKIQEIHHEVNYNNGSSVKDAVARVEKRVSEIDEGVASLHKKVDSQKVALDKADDDLRHELEKTRPPRKPRTPKPKE